MEPIRFESKDSFVAYSLPGKTDYNLLYQNQSGRRMRTADEPHFIISPFDLKDALTHRIYADHLEFNRAFSFKPSTTLERFVDTRSSYLKKADRCIDAARSQVEKVVLSRIKEKEVECKDVYDTFVALVNIYPDALTYIFYVPDVGCWVGASPELLLRWGNKHGTTMALAGSRSTTVADDKAWSAKNLAEQAKVSTYLEHVLTENQVTWERSDVHVKRAGPVEHLCTTYQLSGLKDDSLSLVMALHPTPAVCGQPLEAAKCLIANVEQHDRRYYAGFLGPMYIAGQSQCFVNLRCMELSVDRGYLYVGGGIMPDSQAPDEWEETEIKAKTLGSILDTVYFSGHAIK